MPNPFYTAPSAQVVRERADAVFQTRDKWSRETINLIKNLDEFADKTAREISASRVTKSQVQRALALEYEASDWKDLIFLCETMEHDDFTQISNRAKFLVKDHADGYPVALERLRKALPEFKGKSDRHIRNSPIVLSQAQQTIAQEYGFDGWARLRKFIRSHPPTEGFLNTPGALPPTVAELMEAVDVGDASKVKDLVDKNPSLVHARVSSDITCGDTLLHRADPKATNGSRMTDGHLKVAEILIKNGIDINAMGGCGDSCFTPPIDASSWIGNRQMVQLLLKYKADPNRAYWSMTPPVQTAANHRGRAIFRMLVDAGASYTLYETISLGLIKMTKELLDQQPQSVNEACRGSIPLVIAVEHPKVFRLLLSRNADPNLRDEHGLTALMAATQAANKEVIDELQAHGVEPDVFSAIASGDRKTVVQMIKADPSCHKSKFLTPVILAVVSGDKSILKNLLENGANPNETQQRWMQNNPLVAAASFHQDHLIPTLLAHGAEVNAGKDTPWSIPLTAAVRWGTHRSARLMLVAGADPSATWVPGIIGHAMGWTGYVGDMLAMKMLLDFGANKEARGQALISAARHGKLALVELLGTLDTDINYKVERGTPIQQARSNRHSGCVDLLNELSEIHQLPPQEREAILKPRADFLHFVFSNDSQSLDKLLSEQPELIDREVVREAVFHYATGNLQSNTDKNPLLGVVDTLVEHGVPWTIHSAIACGRVREAERFLNQPKDLDRAVHTAAKFNNVKMLQMLLEAGANVNSKETWGSALHEAVRYLSIEAATLLIENGANLNSTNQYGETPRANYLMNIKGDKRRETMCQLLDESGAKI